MSTLWDVETFLHGIPKEMSPFVITEITKLGDTIFDICVDLEPDCYAHTSSGDILEDVNQQDSFPIVVSYLRENSMFSMGMRTWTELPISAYGWASDCINGINVFGNDRISKVSLSYPEPEEEQTLKLIVGWDMIVADPSLFFDEGLRMMTALIHGTISRLCAEAYSLSIQLTATFKENFPGGRLDA